MFPFKDPTHTYNKKLISPWGKCSVDEKQALIRYFDCWKVEKQGIWALMSLTLQQHWSCPCKSSPSHPKSLQSPKISRDHDTLHLLSFKNKSHVKHKNMKKNRLLFIVKRAVQIILNFEWNLLSSGYTIDCKKIFYMYSEST